MIELDLLNENIALNTLIKQYQSTLEIIMTRFRSQTVPAFAHIRTTLIGTRLKSQQITRHN